MPQITTHNGEHPSGRKATITEFSNGFCSWAIYDDSGKIYAGEGCESLSAAKAQVRKHTYHLNERLGHTHVPASTRWKWCKSGKDGE